MKVNTNFIGVHVDWETDLILRLKGQSAGVSVSHLLRTIIKEWKSSTKATVNSCITEFCKALKEQYTNLQYQGGKERELDYVRSVIQNFPDNIQTLIIYEYEKNQKSTDIKTGKE